MYVAYDKGLELKAYDVAITVLWSYGVFIGALTIVGFILAGPMSPQQLARRRRS